MLPVPRLFCPQTLRQQPLLCQHLQMLNYYFGTNCLVSKHCLFQGVQNVLPAAGGLSLNFDFLLHVANCLLQLGTGPILHFKHPICDLFTHHCAQCGNCSRTHFDLTDPILCFRDHNFGNHGGSGMHFATPIALFQFWLAQLWWTATNWVWGSYAEKAAHFRVRTRTKSTKI